MTLALPNSFYKYHPSLKSFHSGIILFTKAGNVISSFKKHKGLI